MKEEFPNLFSLVVNKEAWVGDMIKWNEDVANWDVLFGRDLQDWELEEVMRFFEKIYSTEICRDEEDKIVWRRKKNGRFSVGSFYATLVYREGRGFPSARVWVPNAPIKISFFLWVACWDKCLTIDNLIKRGFQLPNCCIMCKQEAEFVDHLLLHCEIAKKLWTTCFKAFGIQWVMPRSVQQLLYSWWCKSKNKEALVIWKLVPHATLWAIWRERNRRTFEGGEWGIEKLKYYIFDFLFEWGDPGRFFRRTPLEDFVDSLIL